MTDMLTAATNEHGSSDPMPRRSPAGRARSITRRLDLAPNIAASNIAASKIAASKLASVPALDLLRTVEQKVIPLLHAALQKDLQRPQHPLISEEIAVSEKVTGEEVTDFAERMLGGTFEGACDRIDTLRSAGRSLENIYLRLLAPAACHLRDLWSNDFCGFADMTFALCTLQSVLRQYAQDFYAETTCLDTGSRVLVVTPSDNGLDLLTPMFGLTLMSQFFRRDGWDASIERDLTCGSFRQSTGEWFDMVEVLAANDKQLDEIASGIRMIRRGSPNPSIGIIVCGQIFSDSPDYIRMVGADLMASDPLSSLSQARSFLSQTHLSNPAPLLNSQTKFRRLA